MNQTSSLARYRVRMIDRGRDGRTAASFLEGGFVEIRQAPAFPKVTLYAEGQEIPWTDVAKPDTYTITGRFVRRSSAGETTTCVGEILLGSGGAIVGRIADDGGGACMVPGVWEADEDADREL